MSSVGDTASVLPSLIAENAWLKTRIALPEHERVLQDVLQEQLQRFFDDAKHALEDAISKTFISGGDNEEEEEREGRDVGSRRFSALAETLRVLSAQNEELLSQMCDMQTQRIAILNGQVEALEHERGELQRRVLALEEEVLVGASGATDEHLSHPQMAELRSLRLSDAVFRQNLEGMQQQTEKATVVAEKLVKDGAHASLVLPRLLERLEEMRGTLHKVDSERELLRLQLCESQDRTCIRHVLREKRLEEEVGLAQTTIQKLLQRIAVLESRESKEREEIAIHMRTIEQLESTIYGLQQRQTEVDETLASKRRRIEEELLDDPDFVRHEFITFWREGRQELEQLREEVQQLRTKEQLLRPLRVKLAQMERTRSTVTSKLVSLADEIARLREENQTLRAQYTGLEVERDYLRASLASALAHHMHEDDLHHCCTAIREAAAKYAAASSSFMADPQAIQQAMRQSQELKNDVAQLTLQKDMLHRHIALREERVAALITREAMYHRSTKEGGCSVSQVILSAESEANDVLFALEGPSSTHGGSQRRETFANMQQHITEGRQQLDSLQKKLEEVTLTRDHLQEQLKAMQVEMQATLAAREAAMAELLNSNAVLVQSTDTLRSEKERLRECYDSSVAFTQRMLTGFGSMLKLLRAEVGFTSSLSGVLVEERVKIVELARRSADTWDSRENELQHVLDAIEKMRSYMTQTVEQQQRIDSIENTMHIRNLTEVVKKQEERLSEMERTFVQACRNLSEDLAHRIAEAQQLGDTMWKKRLATLFGERQYLQAQLGAERDLLTRIERFNTNRVLPHMAPVPSGDSVPPSALPDGKEAGNLVLDAINQLLAVMTPQPLVERPTDQPPPAPITEAEKDGMVEEETGGSA